MKAYVHTKIGRHMFVMFFFHNIPQIGNNLNFHQYVIKQIVIISYNGILLNNNN